MVRAATNADPYGMTNKKSNSKDKCRDLSTAHRKERDASVEMTKLGYRKERDASVEMTKLG